MSVYTLFGIGTRPILTATNGYTKQKIGPKYLFVK
jgi:hypothetical protein